MSALELWCSVEGLAEDRTDRVVLKHGQWAMGSWACEGLVVPRHGHGYQAHGDGARFGCSRWSVVLHGALRTPKQEPAYLFWPSQSDHAVLVAMVLEVVMASRHGHCSRPPRCRIRTETHAARELPAV